MKKHIIGYLILLCLTNTLIGCGFHLQGETHLAPPLHRLYIEAKDPYSYLVRNLRDYLKMSQVTLVDSPAKARTVLVIIQDDESQELLGVSGTQQTRQYKLKVTVVFQITNATGEVLVGPQTLSEERSMTIQSNQVLGSSNEANLYYLQMRRALSYAIMNRIASEEITKLLLKREKATSRQHP